MNIEILGALLKNATYVKDYDFVMDILFYATEENIKPSPRFIEILSKFKNASFHSLQSEQNSDAQIKYNRFYAAYKKWKEQMALDGLSRDEATKLVNVHPWKQLKESEGDGIEMVKNKKTRRYWKVQHALVKLTPDRLDRLHKQNPQQIENIETNVESNDK